MAERSTSPIKPEIAITDTEEESQNPCPPTQKPFTRSISKHKANVAKTELDVSVLLKFIKFIVLAKN